jgi:hypothetical protein
MSLLEIFRLGPDGDLAGAFGADNDTRSFDWLECDFAGLGVEIDLYEGQRYSLE